MRILRVQTGGSAVNVQLPQRVQDTTNQDRIRQLETIARSQDRQAGSETLALQTQAQQASQNVSFTQEHLQTQQRREQEQQRRAEEEAKRREQQLELFQDEQFADAALALETIKLDFQERGGSRQQYIERTLKAINSFNLDPDAKRALVTNAFALASEDADRENRKREAELEEIADAQRQLQTQTALWGAQQLGQELRYATGAKRTELLGQANSMVNGFINDTSLDPMTGLEVSSALIEYLRPFAEDGSELAVTINRFNSAQTELVEVFLDDTLRPSERLFLEQQIKARHGYAATPVLPDQAYDMQTIYDMQRLEQDFTRFQTNLSLEQTLAQHGMIGQVAEQYRNNPVFLETSCRQSGSASICEAAEVANMLGDLDEQKGQTSRDLARIDEQIASLQAAGAREIASLIRRNAYNDGQQQDPFTADIASMFTPQELAFMQMASSRSGRALTPQERASLEQLNERIMQARDRQIAALQTQKETLVYEYQRQQAALEPYFGGRANAAANAARSNLNSGGANPSGPAVNGARPGF